MRSLKLYWKFALKNLKSYKRLYRPLILASAFLFSLIILIMSIKDVFYMDGRIVSTFVSFGIVVISVFSGLFYFFGRRFLFRQRGKEMGLLTTLGLGKPEFISILFIELILTYLLTTILAVVIAFVTGPLVTLIFQKLLEVPLEINWTLSVRSIILAAFIFAIIHLFSFIPEISHVARFNPKEFMTSGKKSLGDTKASWFLSLVALLFIGAAYYFSITIVDPVKSSVLFLFSIILVILGTYAFFNALLIFALKALKKNKKLYHKPQHFINLSGMLYRVKEHASGMANITILACMIIVTLTMTLTFFRAIPKAEPEDKSALRYTVKMQGVLSEIIQSNEGQDYHYYGLKDRELAQKVIRQSDEALKTLKPSMIDELQHALQAAGITVKEENIRELRFYESWYENWTPFWLMTQDDAQKLGVNEVNEDAEIVFVTSANAEEKEAMERFLRKHFKGKNLVSTQVNEAQVRYQGKDVNLLLFRDEAATLDAALKISEAQETMTAYGSHYLPDFKGNTLTMKELHSFNDSLNGFERTITPEFREKLPAGVGYSTELYSPLLERMEFLSLFGLFLFLGVFCGMTFLIGMTVTTWFRQISEAENERRRVQIMQQIGLEERVIRKAARSQIFWILILPLLLALVHCTFALPYMDRLLQAFTYGNGGISILDIHASLLSSWGMSALFLTCFYMVVYFISAGSYWRALEIGSRHDARR